MDAEHWERVASLFHAASELPEENRITFLTAACKDDPQLRQEIEHLLESHDASGPFLEKPPLPLLENTPEPHRLKQYILLEKIGEGGMGVVYKARDERLDRLAAIKLINPPPSALKDAIERFIREARAASALDHPNICTVYGLDDAPDGRPFIAMAFYAGETLRQKIEHGRLGWQDAANVGRQAAEGLARAHAAGIVHRDIKPANIMVRQDGLVKILDFGIAKLAGEATVLEEPVSVLGTIPYMSPEQLEGISADWRTDVWSLGVVLWEAVTGHLPFERKSMAQMILAILADPPAAPVDTRVEVPDQFHRIIERSLQKDPARRYSSMDEMAVDLRNVAHDGAAPDARQPAAKDSAIAVMPFLHLTGDPERESLSDGLTEELIHTLSLIRDLDVISSGRMFQYKGKRVDAQEIGRDLHASEIIEGSIRESGSRVRTTVQLSDAISGDQLWSARYERELTDIFALQDEVAQKIVNTLLIRFGARRSEHKPWCADSEARRLFNEGRDLCRTLTPSNVSAAIRKFKEAAERAPEFTEAHVALAIMHLQCGISGTEPPRECWANARTAAERALQLDAERALPHACLGVVHAVADWDWSDVKREFDAALALGRNEPLVASWYSGYYLQPRGQFDEALEEELRSIVLEPSSPVFHASAAQCCVHMGRYEDAARHARDALRASPWSVEPRKIIATVQMALHTPADAIATLEGACARQPEDAETLALMVAAYGAAGQGGRAQEVFEELTAMSGRRYVAPSELACAAFGIGHDDAGFDWLEQSIKTRETIAVLLRASALFERIRLDPRYIDLLRNTQLPVAA